MLLLAIATIGSAWCAFEVSRWNREENDAARVAAVARIDGSREYALATQTVAYDAAVVTQYATAVVAENTPLQNFLRTSLVRPGFLPVLEEWQAIVDSTGVAPPNLFENEDYLGELFAASRVLDDKAQAATDEAEEAGDNAEDYVLTTLFMASALFFAGVTASFSSRFTKVVLLAGSAVTLAFAASRLAGFPVA